MILIDGFNMYWIASKICLMPDLICICYFRETMLIGYAYEEQWLGEAVERAEEIE